MVSVPDDQIKNLPVDNDGLPRLGYTVQDVQDVAKEMIKILSVIPVKNISDVDFIELEEETTNG